MRQILLADAVAFVIDLDKNLFAVVFPNGNSQNSLLIREFHGIVDQIVKHLMNGIGVGAYGNTLFCAIEFNQKLLIVDLLLKGEKNHHGHFADVKVRHVELPGSGFNSGYFQKCAHQTGQAFYLCTDDIQVVIPVLRLDGAVKNSVNKARNGGHGCAQIV